VAAPPSHAPWAGMDLTAWFGPQGVFSSGDAAHIFGSGHVPWHRRGGGGGGGELEKGREGEPSWYKNGVRQNDYWRAWCKTPGCPAADALLLQSPIRNTS
jgi:hypothetical protein